MKFYFLLVLAGLHSLISLQAQQAKPPFTLSVFAIGNAHYKPGSPFTPYPDINYSASAFLECFKKVSTPCLMQSRSDKILTRQDILKAIQNFVDFVKNREGEQNNGIIYYCGHGIASLSGSMYFVPGDVDYQIEDTTFEFLSKKLLNVDEISQIIIKAQQDERVPSQFIILGDCCSDKIASKLYNGIQFSFQGDSLGTITYDSAFLSRMSSVNSTLGASAAAIIDSAGNLKVPPIDSTKPIIDEIGGLIPELIRSMTMKNNGNQVYYSSAMGNSVTMVAPPDLTQTLDVGPICRRTILYFGRNGEKTIEEYLRKLTEKNFDKLTSPALVNRSRNTAQ